jgi:Zn-dependent protease with chaperone function
VTKFYRHFVLFLALATAAQSAVKEFKPGFNLFSKEQDVQLGREAAAQVEQQMQVVKDQNLENYVQRIGQKLVASPKAGGFPYSFKVVNDKSINAFALPGGFTYVNTGLLSAVENEAQLAGVMAHEISHVALRHGTNQASKANLLQLPAMIAGSVLGSGGGLLGQLAQVGIGLGFNSVLLKYSRDAEKQADLLGAQIMADAGYNPMEMAHFFEKLSAEGGSRAPVFLSDHPDPGDRTQYVQEEVREMPQRDYTSTGTGQLKQIQARLGSLPAAPAPNRARSTGVVGEGNPMPSGDFKEYRNNAFAVSYPGNWEVFGDQGGAAVTIAPRSGLVQDRSGNVAVGYGAMLSFYAPHSRSGSGDLRQDTSDLIGQLRQGNPALQATNSSKTTRIGRDTALVTTLYNQSPMSGREVDMLVTVDRPEGLFYMIFIAPEQNFKQLQPAFEQMLRSVRF